MIPRVQFLLALAVAGTLTACGWHLRGAVDLPPQLKTLRLESTTPGTSLYRSLLHQLQVAGVELLPPGSKGHALLLRDERSQSREVSVDRRARSAERELVLSVTVLLRDAGGEILCGPVKLSGKRIYSYDPNNVIAKQDEERLLSAELSNNLSMQILHVLQAAARGIGADPSSLAQGPCR